MIDVGKLLELAGKATSGPWLMRQQEQGFHVYTHIICGPTEHSSPFYATDCHTDEPVSLAEDAACASYIAACSPEVIQALCAVVVAARSVVIDAKPRPTFANVLVDQEIVDVLRKALSVFENIPKGAPHE